MSEFFRIHATPDHSRKTLRELAVLVHEAEESADDVSLLECWDELERRGGNRNATMGLFMEFYRDEWHKRMKGK